MKNRFSENRQFMHGKVGFKLVALIVVLLALFMGTAEAKTLKLPASLKIIGEEAFMGDTSLESVVLPDGIESIGKNAFANSSLVEIYLPNTLKSIASNAFDNHIPALIIKGYKGTLAETYAEEHDILFVAVKNNPEIVITNSWDEFASASIEMIQEYSSSVNSTSGNSDYATGRLIVKADNDLPDVSDFNISSIVRDPENHYILQFLSDEEAIRCLNYLSEQTGVSYVEPDIPVNGTEGDTIYGDSIQSNSWGVSATYSDAYAADLKARGITSSIVVAVVDTGVDSSHSMLKGRVVSGYDFVQNDTTPQDGHGHGTHVSGTIVDCTPGLKVKVMPVRVLGNNGSGSSSIVGQGIRYAARNGAKVINLSLGGGHSSYKDEAIQDAINRGAVVVVAAGNNSSDTGNHCPAHISSCITVSAVDSSKQKAGFSNYGSAVDIAAPGVAIKSSVPGGGYESWNGTSMAAPHVSAAAAMLLLDHYTNIESQLRKTAEDLGATGWDKYYGAGFLCLESFIKGQQEYTIKYNANGGSGAPEAQTKIGGKTITLSTTKPTRLHIVSFNDNAGNTTSRIASGTFQNWNTSSNGTGTSYNSGASYSTDESVTLYAQWKLPTVGSLPTPTRSGYTFSGWYTASSGGSKISSSTTVSSDVTYYAHWEGEKWSDWTTTPPPSGSEYESKKQYRSRSISKTTQYSEWGGWISNGTSAIEETQLRQVQTVEHAAQTKTVYKYDHYKYYNTSKSSWYFSYADTSGNSWSTQGRWESVESDTAYTQYSWESSNGYDGWRDGSSIPWFHQTKTQKTITAAYTEYQYRERTSTQAVTYGEWSNWSDTPVSATDSLDVETRTVYRTKEN